VNRLGITLAAAAWQTMVDDMARLAGPRGGTGPADPGVPPGGDAGPPQQGGRDFTEDNPVWVKATITFDGRTWPNAGIRFKGNSSLRSAWRSGTDRLPFKLDFDQWEDEHPETEDQRFYGFKQLSLGNNFGDATGMRETVVYELLDEFGLVAARSAPYEVVLDRGQGEASLGLYTAVELIDDTVVPRVFKESSGNLYKANGMASSFATGTSGGIPGAFDPQRGANPDWTDIRGLYEAIHSDARRRDPAAWRRGLEAVFDVPSFLKWLALATAVQHWDTYGGMPHNYYLYHDPAARRFTWISWDHNLVLGARPSAGGTPDGRQAPGGRRGGGGGTTSFDKRDVSDDWPLIRFLVDEPEYYRAYVGYLREAANSVFDADRLAARYAAKAATIAKALPARDLAAYEGSVAALTATTRARREALMAFLATA
jgi:spore coat protein CotH